MSTLILHLPAGPAGEYAYALSSDGLRADRHGHAAAGLLPDPGRTGQTVAVVPHQALSWHLVSLPHGVPTGSRRGHVRLRAVLDGLLEERLLDEPSQLHLALQPQARAGEPCWVAACNKAWLHAHLQALESAGRPVGRIVPECPPQATPQLWAVGSPESAWLLATGLSTAPQGMDSLACLPLRTDSADPAMLAALLQALPGGMQEEITLYFADQDLDGLFAKSLGRIAHLMQAVAHVQGYLDGMGQPLQAVSGEMHELVAGSFLSPIWLTTAQHLAAGHDIEPGELADVPLRRDIHNAFATFGLQLREEDGDVWVDVQPIARPETLH